MIYMIIRLSVLYLTLTSTAATSIITPLPGAVVVDGKTAGLPTLTLDRSMTLTRHVGLLARAASLSLLACAAHLDSVRRLDGGQRRLHGLGDAGNLRGACGLPGWWLRRLGASDGRFQRCASTSSSDTEPDLPGCHSRERDAQSGREEDLRRRGTMVGFGRA